ncbi:MAG: Fic family protein [Bacilli bacterium]|nr:Fic family protein [Bacilli bacterium]
MEIHRRLFSALYDWAGKPRTINIYKAEPLLGGKSIDYVFASYIDTALKELQKEFVTTDWESLNPSKKIEKVCYFVSEFWHIHPFREGNTRTSAMVLYFLIKKTGLHVNVGFLSRNGKFFRNALVLSCLYSSSKTGYLLGIVTDSVTLKNEISGKYETIEGTEVKKYSYSHHTTNKLETIKKPADWK